MAQGLKETIFVDLVSKEEEEEEEEHTQLIRRKKGRKKCLSFSICNIYVVRDNSAADEQEDCLQMLVQQEDGSWLHMEDVTLNQVKNKDIVTFEIEDHIRRLVLQSDVLIYVVHWPKLSIMIASKSLLIPP